MKKLKILCTVIISLLVMAVSCTKEEPENRDVFRCEINGEPWEAGCDSQNLVWSCDYMDCQYYENSGGFELIASNKGDEPSGFRISKSSASGGVKIGNNEIETITFGRNSIQYRIQDCCPGNLNITSIDFLSKSIEGNFQFVLYSLSGDSLKIENGYFKSKYRP